MGGNIRPQLLEDINWRPDYSLSREAKEAIAEVGRPQLQEDIYLAATGRDTVMPQREYHRRKIILKTFAEHYCT